MLLKVTIFTTTLVFAGIILTNTARAALFGMFSSPAVAVPSSIQGDATNSQTVTLLQGARNIDPNPSRGGAEVYITEDTALVAENAPFNVASEDQTVPPVSDQISLYLVQEGDSLSQVAQMFNVSVNTVVWANELSSSKDIHPGQTLLILPISGVQHVVKKGDSVKSLAQKYSGDATEIIAYNSLPEDGTLAVGETVTIPGGLIEEEKKTTAKYTKVATGGPTISGYFTHPLPGSIKTQGIHGYNAIDLGAPAGTPVLAAAAGKVIVSRAGGWNGGYGNYIVIDHANGTQTLYSHNSSNTVWQGQSVVAGQVIGYVGSTGRSTGNHLHFEVRGAKNPF
jgi:LysM repeat protein